MTLSAEGAPGALGHVRTPGQRSYDDVVRPGTRVEVRSRFESRWTRGFEVADRVDSEGEAVYRVRRRSDNSILPATFRANDLREESHRGTWWMSS